MPSAAPTDEELAAIVAAVEVAWPRAIVVEAETSASLSSWRMSGRWWRPRLPVAAERRRP